MRWLSNYWLLIIKNLKYSIINIFKSKKFLFFLIISISIFSLSLLSTNFAIAVKSTTYYVSNDGSDFNDGLSVDSAWRTIDKVNDEMNGGVISVGDDVLFRRGDHFIGKKEGDLNLLIRHGGTVDNWMIIGAYGEGPRPILEGNAKGVIGNWDWGNYTKIEHLQICNSSGSAVSLSGMGTVWHHNITISNCHVYNSGNNGIIASEINHFICENCDVHNIGNSGIVVYGGESFQISNTIIRNCTAYDIDGNDAFCHHNDGLENRLGKNHLVINCTGYNAAENAFDITSGENMIYKDCVGYACGWSNFGLGHNVTNVTLDNCVSFNSKGTGDTEDFVIGNSRNTIMRYCIGFNADHHSLVLYSDKHGWNPPVEDGKVVHALIYHNTLIGYQRLDSSLINVFANYSFECEFKNNIFAAYGNHMGLRYLTANNHPMYMKDHINWVNNLWWEPGYDTLTGEDGENWWDVFSGNDYNFSENDKEYGWNIQFPSEMCFDPGFSDVYNQDFSLKDSSNAVDAGSHLTWTVQKGNGNIVSVENARYFIDGYNLIEGDIIRIGDNRPVRILDVDHKENNLLINESVSWEKHDPISLNYFGVGPDVGAFEKIADDSNDRQNEFFNIESIDASKSYTSPSERNDINNNNFSNLKLIINYIRDRFLKNWIQADINNDGIVNLFDVILRIFYIS